jgi:phosphopentomutase
MGVIGYMTDGAALFNALDAAGRDAVAHEIQDTCDGHPEMSGSYHYHGLSSCLAKTEGNNQLLGYALDGFGIFGNKDESGNVITSDDLDECHGTTSNIVWDGKTMNMYHYVLTNDYPYSIGCFKGTPIRAGR